MVRDLAIDFVAYSIRYILSGTFSRFKFHKPQTLEFPSINQSGIYVHVPFCAQLCPYCPYNRIPYDGRLASEYIKAVKKEIQHYSQRFPKLRPLQNLF